MPPSDADIAREIGHDVDPDAIFAARRKLRVAIGTRHAAALSSTYERMNTGGPYSPDAKSAGRRALKNVCLDLMAVTQDGAAIARALAQYASADNMTDRMAALETLAQHDRPERAAVLDDFYRRYADDPLIIDKWLALQAIIPEPATLDRVRALTGHPAFSMANPNRVRSLIGAFAQANHTQFNRLDGAGYDFVADIVLKLDPKNPQVAARIMGAFRSWRALEARRRQRAEATLRRVAATSNLSSDVHDIVARTLADSGIHVLKKQYDTLRRDRSIAAQVTLRARFFCSIGGAKKRGTKVKKILTPRTLDKSIRVDSNGLIRGRCGTYLRTGSRGSSETEAGMARAETASASLRSDSIKGLAQSIANPAYRRLLTAEPVLRRAVPVLIVAFMLTICIGAAVQVLEHRRQVIVDSIRTSEALADHLAAALDRTARDGRPTLPRSSEALTRALPAWAAGAGRSILVADVDGAIIASVPNDPSMLGRHILDVLGPTQPLPTANPTGTTENMSAGRRRRVRHHAGAAQSDRLPCRRAAAQRSARQLALDHGADRHALRHHRLRRPHPRLRLPLAGDAGARSGFDPRHRALPHRHRAQSRPLRAVGLGPGARPGVLVAFDVRHSRPAAEGRFAHLRRSQRAGAQGRHQSLRARHPSRRRQESSRSTMRSACAMPTAAGCGCGRAANWRARRAKPACI